MPLVAGARNFRVDESAIRANGAGMGAAAPREGDAPPPRGNTSRACVTGRLWRTVAIIRSLSITAVIHLGVFGLGGINFSAKSFARVGRAHFPRASLRYNLFDIIDIIVKRNMFISMDFTSSEILRCENFGDANGEGENVAFAWRVLNDVRVNRPY